jgi:hypothetical protein
MSVKTYDLFSTILGNGMLTKQQLISCIIGLKETNDLQVLDATGFLDEEICYADDVPLVKRMAAIIDELFDAFDYAKSPEFLRLVDGKSAEVRAMRLKMLTPVRRKEMRKRLGDALAKVLESDEVLELVESVKHERIKELRNLLLEVSNPDESIAK